jgi:signal transduction histidine kinase
VWGPGLAEQIAWVLLVVAMALFYLWSTSEGDIVPRTLISLFGGAAPDATTQLRSQYEQQIRESARQEERNRLARDLHDSVKQQIFVIQASAATAQARFGGDPAGASEALEQIRVSAREAMTEMQAMLDQLRAVPLENPGLIEALKAQCEALGFRTGARVEFKLADLPPAVDLPPGAHEAILRVAQEALANVGRHARARNVLVTLGAFRGQVELGIKDDGSGFDPEHSRRGQGLANIRARAEEFSGKFEVISRPGGGTYVAFSVPYTSGLTPREYRNRAAIMAVALGLLILEFAWIKSLWILPWLLLASVGVIRYVVAYRRARLRGEAA